MYIYIYIHIIGSTGLKNNIDRVHYSEFHVLNIHQAYISTSSKRKTKNCITIYYKTHFN